MPLIPTPAPVVYPSLQSICDLFRSLTNTSVTGVAANTVGFMLPFLNSSIQDTFADLRTVGSPCLIRDGVVIEGLPISPNQGFGQQALSFTSFFDGVAYDSGYSLPPDLIYPERIWQRQSGVQDQFVTLPRMGTLPDALLSYGLGAWEWREDQIFFIGTPQGTPNVDIRIRYYAQYPDLSDPTIDFTQTFVPIMGALNAITYKMTAKYAFRMTPEQFSMAKAEADEMTTKLRQEIVLNTQGAMSTSRG